jgi:hypothetical protein
MMTVRIALTNGEVAIVDDGDAELVQSIAWGCLATADGKKYARVFRKRGGAILMHRLLVGATKGQYVDHRDGDGLNNTRANLRVCTNSQNMMNLQRRAAGTSLFKGVAWAKDNQKWTAQIKRNYRKHHLGMFTSEVAAAFAYDKAAIAMFGEFARPNFPCLRGE